MVVGVSGGELQPGDGGRYAQQLSVAAIFMARPALAAREGGNESRGPSAGSGAVLYKA